MSLTIKQTRDDLLSKLGITDPAEATPQVLQDVVVAINGAMQLLNTAGQDFFTRQYYDLTLTAGTSFYTLPANIQAVLGPVRWNDTKPLRALESRGELDQFARIFLDETGYGTGPVATPEAYWIEGLRNSLSAGDIEQINVWMAPAPTSPTGFVRLEVIKDAVAYVVGDLSSDVVVPVAQNYTESVFLPIARMFITRSFQFSRPDILDQLQADYDMAIQTLADKGGFPNAVQPAPKREVEA